jgi:Flp pilus assembly protein TadG
MMWVNRRRLERGQVLVIFAVAAVAVFAIVALAVDGGRIMMDQRGLQNGVDGAALTGAADIGPNIGPTQGEIALDDAVYAVEQSLGLSFANNYTCPGPSWCPGNAPGVVAHVLQAGPCRPNACDPGTTPHGPYQISSGVGPCCVNWTDTTGAYVLNMTTPYTFGGAEKEAFIHIDLVHHLPLVIGGFLYPTVDVHVQATARNYALGYAIFAFKRNDVQSLNGNGSGPLDTNKNMGSNGGAAHVGAGAITFTCLGSPSQFGGDLHTWIPATATVNGVANNSCPGPLPASSNVLLGGYRIPPNVHLPDDPCLSVPAPASPNCTGLAAAITVTGTQMLQPTRSSVDGQTIGPRYSLVNVTSGNTLYLQPGIYYFEGTGTTTDQMGLQINGGSVVTGDCWQQTLPTCNATYQYTNATGICQPATQLALAITGVLQNFQCTPQGDFGVLLVFWPAGPSPDPACTVSTSTRSATTYYYCADTTTSVSPTGSVNRLRSQGAGNIYLTASPMYHNVAVFMDQKHATSSWNFTDSTTLPAGCTTQTCAQQEGNGASILYIQGGGNISILGATLAPTGTVFIGGASGGKGYGQLLIYLLHWQGSGTINEQFNPLALAYAPVLVQ